MFDVDIGLVWPDAHPNIFLRLIEADVVDAMHRTLEGKMIWLTYDIPTLYMDRIWIDMEEHVVGVPLAWLILIQKVSRYFLYFQEVVEKVAEALASP